MNLTPAELEHFEERAAIMEHEALLPRADAERLAMECVMASRLARMEQRQERFASIVTADMASGREQARALAKRLRQ